MDWFFDSSGRDMVIADWLKRNKPEYVKIYEHILARQSSGHQELNELILLAFETGIEFARASKREARVNSREITDIEHYFEEHDE